MVVKVLSPLEPKTDLKWFKSVWWAALARRNQANPLLCINTHHLAHCRSECSDQMASINITWARVVRIRARVVFPSGPGCKIFKQPNKKFKRMSRQCHSPCRAPYAGVGKWNVLRNHNLSGCVYTYRTQRYILYIIYIIYVYNYIYIIIIYIYIIIKNIYNYIHI